jgi:hypothetical protein
MQGESPIRVRAQATGAEPLSGNYAATAHLIVCRSVLVLLDRRTENACARDGSSECDQPQPYDDERKLKRDQ